MFEFYYSALSVLFAPLLVIPSLGIFILASVVSFIITLLHKLLVDQEKVKKIREEIKEIQKQIKKLEKTEVAEANRLTAEMLKLTNKQMMSNIKPMLASMVLLVLLLPWVASTFPNSVAMLPFSLPFFGNDFGWLAWYVIASIPFSMLSRKLLDVG